MDTKTPEFFAIASNQPRRGISNADSRRRSRGRVATCFLLPPVHGSFGQRPYSLQPGVERPKNAQRFSALPRRTVRAAGRHRPVRPWWYSLFSFRRVALAEPSLPYAEVKRPVGAKSRVPVARQSLGCCPEPSNWPPPDLVSVEP
jgi:hypothetical protein